MDLADLLVLKVSCSVLESYHQCSIISHHLHFVIYVVLISKIGLRACCLERSIVKDRIWGVRTSIPPAISYPIEAKKGLPFGMSLVKMFYSESLIDKLMGIIGLIKNA